MAFSHSTSFQIVDGHVLHFSEALPSLMTGRPAVAVAGASWAPPCWLAPGPALPPSHGFRSLGPGLGSLSVCPQQLSFSAAARDPLVPIHLPRPPSRVTVLKRVPGGLVLVITPPVITKGLRR